MQRLSACGWSSQSLQTMPDGVRVVGEAVAVNYPEGGLEALGLDGGSGYWFDHRAGAVVDVLHATTDARSIWDIGAGAGSMSLRFANAGYDVVSVEPLPEGASAIAAKHCSTVFCGSLEGLHLPDHSIEVIGLFDVIEHLDEPKAMMHEVARVLKPGAVVVVTVPAFPALWSSVDDVAGHQQRFTKKSLDAFMDSCGLEHITSKYLFASLLPAALIFRTIPYRLGRRHTREQVQASTSRRLAPNETVDKVAGTILRAESAVAKIFPLPFGLSVLGAYRTPADPTRA
jgi:2-polyprenyl-3-methyl-5-hydroxy-6-metoxy-1,4-benzoquinol methylase